MDQAKNFAKATVDGGYDGSVTEIDIVTSATLLPSPPFNAVWWNATDYPDPADDPSVEIVRVTVQDGSTLTITRAQEGTAAEDHNLAGKTYKLLAGLTAKMVNQDLVGDVHGSGPALTFDLVGPDTRWRYSDAGDRFVEQDSTGIIVQSVRVFLGDIHGAGNSGVLDIDDTNSRVVFSNLDFATTQAISATGPVGTIVAKLMVRDSSGDIVGYLPIYGSIT